MKKARNFTFAPFLILSIKRQLFYKLVQKKSCTLQADLNHLVYVDSLGVNFIYLTVYLNRPE